MEKRSADSLIHARWIIPVSGNERLLDHHSVAIKDGDIIDILPTAKAREAYEAVKQTSLDSHVLIPGLVNTHTHAAMSLFRGLADDLPLMTWLNEHIWPAEQRWIGEQFVTDGTRLAIAEMIRGGTTCFNDMYFFPDITAAVARQEGIRATVGLIVFDFPSAWGDGPDDYINKGLALHDKYRNDELISTAFAPHAPYTTSDAPLGRIRMLADELDIQVHMHVHESRDEIIGSLEQYGMRPLERLHKLGMVGPQLMAVHMTQLTDEEILLCAESGLHVVHCVESNLKLASGFTPVEKLREAGINIALGTDGAASNNDLDMFGEMRTASLVAKAVGKSAQGMPALDSLRAATLNGAIALGIEERTGSIEKGKAADLVAINLDHPATTPVYDPVSLLVYSASRDQVSDVWVNGRQLLRDGKHTSLDIAAVKHQATYWKTRIAA
ncbi:MAG: TRZ/ATZ family hydrolase, partial [Sedimenticolaceae bacterium]|nr:TRZ/ATZ family hydrolase [Sedimenticolaceae bacterium]